MLLPYFCFQVVKIEEISPEEIHISVVELPCLNLLKIREIQPTRFIWADSMASVDPIACNEMISPHMDSYLLVSTSAELIGLLNRSVKCVAMITGEMALEVLPYVHHQPNLYSVVVFCQSVDYVKS